MRSVPLILLFSIFASASLRGVEAGAEAPDFGDQSSATLTGKAWAALEAANHEHVVAYTTKCIKLYGQQAVDMQKSLTELPPAEKAHDYWALNDVGTCFYIRATSSAAAGKAAEALEDYKKLAEFLSFAQTWDTKGWFWQPATVAKQKIKEMEFDAL